MSSAETGAAAGVAGFEAATSLWIGHSGAGAVDAWADAAQANAMAPPRKSCFRVSMGAHKALARCRAARVAMIPGRSARPAGAEQSPRRPTRESADDQR